MKRALQAYIVMGCPDETEASDTDVFDGHFIRFSGHYVAQRLYDVDCDLPCAAVGLGAIAETRNREIIENDIIIPSTVANGIE